jgi:Na+/melibiose symporter-like transporter
LTSAFASFKLSSFRFLWASDALASCAEQMESVILSWFVLQATGSPLLLGLFGALRFGGHIFAPLYGVVVDRQNRKKLLVGIRSFVGLMASLVLLLAFTGHLAVWHLFVIVAVKGLGRSSDNVTRQAVLADVVARDRLMNGVALSRLAMDGMQIVGPLLGGVLLSQAGIAWAYAPVAGLHLASACLASRVRWTPASRQPAQLSLWLNLRDGARYAWRNQAVLAILAMAFLVNLAAFPLTSGLMPLFARDVLHIGPMGLAALMGASAAGALSGSLLLSFLKMARRPGRFLLVASLLWYVTLIGFSSSGRLPLSLVILVGSGLAQSLTMAPLVMLLLGVVPEHMRGRVMGLRSLAVYGLPFGLLAAGAMAERVGAPLTLAIVAGTGMALTGLLALTLRGLWRLEWPPWRPP